MKSAAPISCIEKVKRKAADHPLLASAGIAAIGSAIWKTTVKRKE